MCPVALGLSTGRGPLRIGNDGDDGPDVFGDVVSLAVDRNGAVCEPGNLPSYRLAMDRGRWTRRTLLGPQHVAGRRPRVGRFRSVR